VARSFVLFGVTLLFCVTCKAIVKVNSLLLEMAHDSSFIRICLRVVATRLL
jgi:hypothetical protein